MKLHRKGFTVLLLALSVSIFAQKQEKKFTETFNVNKDVVIEIEASNAEIDVTTWNKNQVAVEAIIEIEGLTKKEVEKYFKKYKFEALGNKSKVKITSGGNSFHFGNKDFVMFDKDFKMPEIVIPEFEISDIKIPEIDFENIVIPEVNIDKIFLDIEDIDWDQYSKEGKDYFFKWKNGVKEIKIKSKKDWEKFKKSKEYKEWKDEMKVEASKLKKEMAKMKDDFKFDKEKIKKEIAEAMKSVEKIDMAKMKKEFAKAAKEMKNMKFDFDYLFNSEADDMTFNGKKIKIKKKIVVKAPKSATFDLNTRHCKVKLPKTKASGKVSYGSFKAEGLNGGELKIYSSPATINVLNSSKLYLNNVTDAMLASVANSEVNSNSSDLEIYEILSGVSIDSSFGDLVVGKLNTALTDFQLILNQSDAKINFKGFKDKLKFNTYGNKAKVIDYGKIANNEKGTLLKGTFEVTTSRDNFKIKGKYSDLTINQ